MQCRCLVLATRLVPDLPPFYDLPVNDTRPVSGSEVHVHLLPSLVEPEDLRGGVAVVIDVIRASTTIVHALAAGANCVVPCQEVDEARTKAAEYPPGTYLLGGERGGKRIEGFDLGNSPAEFSPEVCRGKTVLFTTTNGTRALAHASWAGRVLIGALVNRRAVCRDLGNHGQGQIHLLCAGRQGAIAREDALAAGAIVDGLSDACVPGNDAARLVRDAYRTSAEEITVALRQTAAADQLRRLGLGGDVDAAGQIDRFDVVPVFERHTGHIVASKN